LKGTGFWHFRDSAAERHFDGCDAASKVHSTRFSGISDGVSYPDLILREVHILRTSLALLLVNFSFAVTLLVLSSLVPRLDLEGRRAELNRLLARNGSTPSHQPELATQVAMIVTTTPERLFGQGIGDDLEHTRQALARFEAIDVTGFPSRNGSTTP